MSKAAIEVLDRMIEEEEKLTKNRYRETRIIALREARDEIESLRSSEDDGWISVSIQNPEDPGEYIIYCKNPAFEINRLTTARWHDEWISMEPVDYWMPLPKPPTI